MSYSPYSGLVKHTLKMASIHTVDAEAAARNAFDYGDLEAYTLEAVANRAYAQVCRVEAVCLFLLWVRE